MAFFGFAKSKPQPIQITATLNERLRPSERGDFYEDPLTDALQDANLGEVVGGGAMLSDVGEIEFCDVEIEATDGSDATIAFIKDKLEEFGAAKGSKLRIADREIPIGVNEGIAVYFNGTELPDSVYEKYDLNAVEAKFDELLEGVGELRGSWNGPTETAIYAYGPSYEAMRDSLSHFMATHPLCEKARVKRIA
jgi:hypothetical protein